MTLPERRLWSELRRLDGHFRRQAPVGRYVPDFVSHSRRLAVELDGPPHSIFPEQVVRDGERDAWFASQGYGVLRFSNTQLMEHVDDVLCAIQAAMLSRRSRPRPPTAGVRRA